MIKTIWTSKGSWVVPEKIEIESDAKDNAYALRSKLVKKFVDEHRGDLLFDVSSDSFSGCAGSASKLTNKAFQRHKKLFVDSQFLYTYMWCVNMRGVHLTDVDYYVDMESNIGGDAGLAAALYVLLQRKNLQMSILSIETFATIYEGRVCLSESVHKQLLEV